MRILNEAGEEVKNPDMTLGYTEPDRILIRHHDAVKAEPEEGYWRPIGDVNPNMVYEVTKQAVEAVDAYDEYEDILRYKLNTDKEA